MNFKIYIRTTGERELHSSIERELNGNYTLLIDREHKPVDSFIDQLELISDNNAILLEDDVILCRDFLNEVNKAIDEFPNMIINFFSRPFIYFETYIANKGFAWNQCTYYPKGVSKIIAHKMREIRKPHQQYDVLQGVSMNFLKISYVNFRPCLVQHIDNNSLIQIKHIKRRTLYFKDYLDELKINMNDARKFHSQLKKILDREFH